MNNDLLTLDSAEAQAGPGHLIEIWTLPDGTRITLRALLPEDEMLLVDFTVGLSRQTRQRWFRSVVKDPSASLLTRPAQMDWQRHLALVVTAVADGIETIVGDARFVIDRSTRCADFALVVSDRWQGRGIGELAVAALIESARHRGLRWLRGDVLDDNKPMLSLMRRCGFCCMPHPEDDGVVRVEKLLQPSHRPDRMHSITSANRGWLTRLWTRSAAAASINLEQMAVDLMDLLDRPTRRSATP